MGTSTQKTFRAVTVVFLVALAVHGADHLRRGFGVETTEVLAGGYVQIFGALVTAVLVFRGHRLAPVFAVAIGFPSAIGFVAVHLAPHWGAFSDSFTGGHPAPGVTWFSWFAALFEIGADAAMGAVGLIMLREQLREQSAVGSPAAA